MNLPKVKKIKLINKKAFVKNAKKVRESFEEQARYLRDKRLKDEITLSSHTYYIS